MPSGMGTGEIVRRSGFWSAWATRHRWPSSDRPDAPREVRLNGFPGAFAVVPCHRINSLPHGNVGNGLFPARLRALPTPLFGLTCMSMVTKQVEVSPRSVPRCRCGRGRGGSPSRKGSEEGNRR